MNQPNPPLANIITLGTRNFEALRDFYRKLGWSLIEDSEGFAAFELRGIVLALFPVDKLAADGRTGAETNRQPGIRSTIGVMLDEREDVDRLTRQWRANGGRVTKEPVDAEYFEGRSAYVADPEDNFWEFTWNGASNSVVDAARRAAGLDR